MSDRSWKQLSTRLIYENPWIKLREDKVLRPDGKEGIYGVIDKNPGVVVIAMNKNNEIYLIEQDRYAISKKLIELPAGASQSKNFEEDAKRELEEEINITADYMELIGTFYSSAGHQNLLMYVYLATNLHTSDSHTNNQEGDEAITDIFKVSIPELKDMIGKNKIEDGMTLSALNLFFNKFEL